MLSTKTPTIKGMFVQAHVEKLRKTRGDKAVATLEERFGRHAYFKRLEDVTIKDETLIIEIVFDLLNEGHTLTGATRDRAAGRLHFDNFAGTTFGGTLMHSMPQTKDTFNAILFSIGPVARSIIKHTEFKAEHIPRGVRVTLRNNDYPPEHFAGFFEEWMVQWGLVGVVLCSVKAAGVHEYTITL